MNDKLSNSDTILWRASWPMNLRKRSEINGFEGKQRYENVSMVSYDDNFQIFSPFKRYLLVEPAM